MISNIGSSNTAKPPQRLIPPMPEFEENKNGLIYVDHTLGGSFKQPMDMMPLKTKKGKKVPKKLLAPLNVYGAAPMGSSKSGKTRLPDIAKGMALASKQPSYSKPMKSTNEGAKQISTLKTSKLPPKPLPPGFNGPNQNRNQNLILASEESAA